MSRKKFAKYMIEERLEQLVPPYEITDWYEPVICANCYREDIIINFAQVQSNLQSSDSSYEGGIVTYNESDLLIMKDVKCPKCRSGLAYRFKFTVVADEPKKKKAPVKKALAGTGGKRRS
ncbi:MAG: DNA-directed RNA polymerase II subunit [Podoviridae sp. ctg2L5]|nr:MAG: DNA-directed RNA polymerase II subunit [Podoviridae sp. ctg2L5]